MKYACSSAPHDGQLQMQPCHRRPCIPSCPRHCHLPSPPCSEEYTPSNSTMLPVWMDFGQCFVSLWPCLVSINAGSRASCGFLLQAEDACLQAACLFAFSCKCWQPLPQPPFPPLLLLLLFNSTLEGTADEMPLNLNCQQWK